MRRITAVSAVEDVTPSQAGGEKTAAESVDLLRTCEEQWNAALPQVSASVGIEIFPQALGVTDYKSITKQLHDADVVACFVLEPGANQFLYHIAPLICHRRICRAVVFSILEASPDDPALKNINVGLQDIAGHTDAGLLCIPTGRRETTVSPVEVHQIQALWSDERRIETFRDFIEGARQRKRELLQIN